MLLESYLTRAVRSPPYRLAGRLIAITAKPSEAGCHDSLTDIGSHQAYIMCDTQAFEA